MVVELSLSKLLPFSGKPLLPTPPLPLWYQGPGPRAQGHSFVRVYSLVTALMPQDLGKGTSLDDPVVEIAFTRAPAFLVCLC
jgi:hypothetical protein